MEAELNTLFSNMYRYTPAYYLLTYVSSKILVFIYELLISYVYALNFTNLFKIITCNIELTTILNDSPTYGKGIRFKKLQFPVYMQIQIYRVV